MSKQALNLAVVLACALILAAPAILNGAPFLYFDTAGYLLNAEWGFNGTVERVAAALFPDPGPVGPAATGAGASTGPGDAGGSDLGAAVWAGRSVYYGLLGHLSLLVADLRLLVALQCLVVAWLVVTLFRHGVPGRWALPSLVTVTALAALTPAALFAGLVMPDVWAGALILAVALWVAWGARLSAWSRGALLAIMVVSVLSHASHLLLLIAMLGLGALAWAASRRVRRHATAGAATAVAASIACGVAGALAFPALVERALGSPPTSLPHLSAHLVDLGPGTAYLRDSCPESGLALCAFVDRLPVDWIAFLFDYDPGTGVFGPASPDVRRAMAEEDLEFALRTVRAAPLATLGGLALDGVSQLWHLSIDDVPMVASRDAFLADQFEPDLVEMTRASWLYPREGLLPVLTALTYASTLLAAVALAANLAQRRGRLAIGAAGDDRLMILIAVCLAGVLLNALVCGVLASPYGRFQARLVWILPLLAALTLTVRLAEPSAQRTLAT